MSERRDLKEARTSSFSTAAIDCLIQNIQPSRASTHVMRVQRDMGERLQTWRGRRPMELVATSRRFRLRTSLFDRSGKDALVQVIEVGVLASFPS